MGDAVAEASCKPTIDKMRRPLQIMAGDGGGPGGLGGWTAGGLGDSLRAEAVPPHTVALIRVEMQARLSVGGWCFWKETAHNKDCTMFRNNLAHCIHLHPLSKQTLACC